jgi:hypothetical protein
MIGDSKKKFCFVSIKGFGDLTILLSMLRRVPNPLRVNCSILLGTHLKELFDTLGSDLEYRLLDVGSKSGAAIFALRTRGIPAGLRNAFSLRLSVAAAFQIMPPTLVFDRLSWREQFISAGEDAVAIPPNQKNIYTAYEVFLKSLFPISAEKSLQVVVGNLIGIFPITSLHRKNLTSTVIDRITSLCLSYGFDPVVFLLDGESLDGPIRAPTINIDRNFPALVKAIDSLAGTICADSLPAHLSAYLYKHVFVVSPAPNKYWYPQSVYANDYWGVFNDVEKLDQSLDKFFTLLRMESCFDQKV